MALEIINNPLLYWCSLDNFCTYLSDDNNQATIENNQLGCESRSRVNAGCQVVAEGFAPIGAEWHYSMHGGGSAPTDSEYLKLRSEKDTMVFGEPVRKITQTYYRFIGDSIAWDPIFVTQLQDTVYWFDETEQALRKLYVFGGYKNDQLILDSFDPVVSGSYSLNIEDAYVEIVDGAPLRVYQTQNLGDVSFYNNGLFMDQVGGLDWFYARPPIIPEAGGPTRCYADSQVDTNFTALACDYWLVSSVELLNNETEIRVFPNPANNVVWVEADFLIEELQLLDVNGKA